MISQSSTTDEEQFAMQHAQGEPGIDYLGVLFRRKWLVFIGLMVGLGLGTLYFFQVPPKYQSTAQLHVTSRGSGSVYSSGQMRTGYDEYMSGYYVSRYVLPTHAVLLKSPLILGRAIRNYSLESLPSFAGEESPSYTITQGLNVSIGAGKEAKDANVLTISFAGRDPYDCQKVVQAVISTYQDYLGETYQSVSQETVQLITQAKDDLDLQLLDLGQKYNKFREEAPLLWRGENGENIHAVKLHNIEAARSKLVVQRVEGIARIEALEQSLKEAKVSKQALELMVKRLAKTSWEFGALEGQQSNWEQQLLPLQIEREALLGTYGASHPRIKELEKRIQMTEEFITSRKEEIARSQPQADLLEVYLQSLKQEVAEIEYQRQSLDKLYNEEYNEAKKLEVYETANRKWREDIERAKSMFNTVIQRLAEINLVKDYGGYVCNVLTHPSPGWQIEPKMWVCLSIGCMLGLLCGYGLGLLVDVADQSFRSADEIRLQLGLPVVAHIPVLDLDRAEQFSKNSPIEPSVVTCHRPKSREAEAFRRVRTSLYFSTNGQDKKVIQVTSPDPSDGKTTLSTNLSVSIAQSGKKVLLIDADFRRPKVHRIFGIKSDVGISQVITNEAELSACIKPTAVENLDLLPCGARPHNPAELLSSKRFRDLLAELREMYDFVIVDTPPVLAVTDPAAVAPCVDGVFVAIRLSKSGKPNANRAIEQLKAVGGNVLGVVVNGVGGERRYGAYGGSGYGSAYYQYASRYYQYDESYSYGNRYGSYYIDPKDEKPGPLPPPPPTSVYGPPANGKSTNGDSH